MQPNSKMGGTPQATQYSLRPIWGRTEYNKRIVWRSQRKRKINSWIQMERSTIETGDQTLQDQNKIIHNSAHIVYRCRTKGCITNNQTLLSRYPTLPKSIDELNFVFLNADTLTSKMSELHLLTKTEAPYNRNKVLPKNHNRQIHLE